MQIHSNPPIIQAVLQLNKPDSHPVSHKIKLERKFTLKGQDPEANKEAALFGLFIIYLSEGQTLSLDIYV